MNYLPGWHPGFFGTIEDAGLIAFIASSTVTNVSTITAPANIQAGDLLIIAHMGSDGDGSPPSQVTPAGFTLLNTAFDNAASKFSWRTSVHYKLATGAEASGSFSVILGNDSGPAGRATFMVFRRSIPATSIVAAGSLTSAGTDLTILSGAGTVPLLVFGVAMMNEDGEHAAISNYVMNPVGDGVVANGADGEEFLLVSRWKIYNVGQVPANVLLDIVSTGPTYTTNGGYFGMVA